MKAESILRVTQFARVGPYVYPPHPLSGEVTLTYRNTYTWTHTEVRWVYALTPFNYDYRTLGVDIYVGSWSYTRVKEALSLCQTVHWSPRHGRPTDRSRRLNQQNSTCSLSFSFLHFSNIIANVIEPCANSLFHAAYRLSSKTLNTANSYNQEPHSLHALLKSPLHIAILAKDIHKEKSR